MPTAVTHHTYIHTEDVSLAWSRSSEGSTARSHTRYRWHSGWDPIPQGAVCLQHRSQTQADIHVLAAASGRISLGDCIYIYVYAIA